MLQTTTASFFLSKPPKWTRHLPNPVRRPKLWLMPSLSNTDSKHYQHKMLHHMKWAMALLTWGLFLKLHGLPTFSKYRIGKETSPEALIIQTTDQVRAMWTEMVLKAVINIFPLYNISLSLLLSPPFSPAGRMDMLHHSKGQFPEMQLRKVLSNNSSIAAACLQIQEGSPKPGCLPKEELEVLFEKN